MGRMGREDEFNGGMLFLLSRQMQGIQKMNKATASPLVTVGIPVYNESARIVDCIRSVQAQTYPNIEICISDNCSSDGTYELARQLAEESSNIRLVRQERNMGALANFGSVRRMAGGEYFMWLGSDDRILPTYIEKMVEQLEAHPRAAVAQSAVLRINERGKVLQEVKYRDTFDQDRDGPLTQAMRALTPKRSARRMKLNLYVYGLFRKSIIDGIGGEEAVLCGDRVLPALAALSGGLRYVEEPLFIKRVRLKKRSPDDPALVERLNRRRVANIVWWVLRCPIIPFWRRWYGLIIVFPFMVERAKKTIKVALPRPIRRMLKHILSWVGASS